MNKKVVPPPNKITASQKQFNKLKMENNKLKADKTRMKNIIEKRDIQLLRMSLKLEQQEMAHIKQMNKLEQKNIELQEEIKKFRVSQNMDILPVDLSKYMDK